MKSLATLNKKRDCLQRINIKIYIINKEKSIKKSITSNMLNEFYL